MTTFNGNVLKRLSLALEVTICRLSHSLAETDAFLEEDSELETNFGYTRGKFSACLFFFLPSIKTEFKN